MKITDIDGKECEIAIDQTIGYWEHLGSIHAPLRYPERVRGIVDTRISIDGVSVSKDEFARRFPALKKYVE